MKKTLRNAGLTFSASMLGLMGIAQTTFIDESFSGTTIPTGWSQTTLATDNGWKFGTAQSNSSQYWTVPAHSGNMAATNDDACNCNKSSDRFITPTINLTNASNTILSFDYFFLQATESGATESFKIQVSTNGGSSWSDLATMPGVTEWTTSVLNLSSYIGQSIQISFLYNDGAGWTYGAAIDNVIVKEVVNFDMAGLTLNVQDYVVNNTPLTLSGTMRNFGGSAITSMRLNYQVNGGAVVSQNLSGLNITTTSLYNFSHATQWTPNANGNHTIKVWADQLNGNADQNNLNDTITVSTYVAANLAQRKVLYEQFTSTTCGPCASSDPAINTFLNNNAVNTHSGKIVALKYHMNYPAPGNDPAYTTECATRATYYSVSGIPSANIGNVYDGHPLNLTQPTIDTEYARPAIFSIGVTGSYSANEVNVNVDLTSYVEFNTANTRLHVVIMENELSRNDFNPLPATNQQTFKYVMRKMLPNANGTLLTSFELSETKNFEFTHTLTNALKGDMENVTVVVFVQNNTTKEVYQVTESKLVSLSLAENSLEKSLNIYPNPASESATLVFDANASDASVEVINSLGQTVHTVNLGTVNGQQQLTIPTATFAEGLYFVTVKTKTGSVATARLSVVK
jgi:predicted nucleotidyltransferase